MYTENYSLESINTTAFFTGHRHLIQEEKPLIETRIYQCASDAYESGYRRFFCGCALGFDTMAAFQIIRLREKHPEIKLSLAIPCATQADRWSSADRETYHQILNLADDQTVLSPSYYRGAMLTRNRFMADRSSLCICWLRHMRGGTASTVRYSLQTERIRIINLAVSDDHPTDILREQSWNCIYTSLSAGRNAVTVPLHLSRSRKLIFRNT